MANTAMSSFSTPRDSRYFEDYQPGDVYEFGSVVMTAPEIIEFAQRYDPQDMHVDPAKAAQGRFGGLIASGWHTIGVTMRILVDHYISAVASLASPGIDEIRWLIPVRPGDTLRVRTTITDARPSRTKNDRGVVHTRVETLNQRDEVVMTMLAMSIVGRRPS
ncbi:MAG: MaoC family dehydratase [Bryobacteraceae bacterium]